MSHLARSDPKKPRGHVTWCRSTSAVDLFDLMRHSESFCQDEMTSPGCLMCSDNWLQTFIWYTAGNGKVRVAPLFMISADKKAGDIVYCTDTATTTTDLLLLLLYYDTIYIWVLVLSPYRKSPPINLGYHQYSLALVLVWLLAHFYMSTSFYCSALPLSETSSYKACVKMWTFGFNSNIL